MVKSFCPERPGPQNFFPVPSEDAWPWATLPGGSNRKKKTPTRHLWRLHGRYGLQSRPHHHIIHNCVTISAKSCLPSLLCPTLSTTKPAGCLGSASMHTQFWTAEVAHVRTAFLWSVEEQSLAGALEITDRDRRQHDQRRYQHGGSQGNGRWTMRRRERYRWLGVETKQTKQTTAIGTIINHHRRSVTHT